MFKKILCALVVTLFCTISFSAKASASCPFSGIGAKLIQDPYNKKIFVEEIYSSTPAQMAGVPVGGQILAVNKKRVWWKKLSNVVKDIRGEQGSEVVLTIKFNKVKKDYVIKRNIITLPDEPRDKYNLHWKQIAPVGLDLCYISENITKNLSRKYRKELLSYQNYWCQRRAAFDYGYDACMTYEKSIQNTCLMNLVNREVTRTAMDQKFSKQTIYLNNQN